MSNNYPTPCTEVSNATLNPDDLLDAFAFALRRCVASMPEDAPGYVEYRRLWGEADELYGTEDGGFKGEVIDDLFDALDEFSPPYCYFGTLEGDGACFGWWPDLHAIEDLPRVSDPSEVEELGEDCVYVNDHGNVTVYGGDGSIIWDCV